MGYTSQSESQLETQSHTYPMNIPQLSCTYSIFRSSHTSLSHIWIIMLQLFQKLYITDIFGKWLGNDHHIWISYYIRMVISQSYPNPRQLRHGHDWTPHPCDVVLVQLVQAKTAVGIITLELWKRRKSRDLTMGRSPWEISLEDHWKITGRSLGTKQPTVWDLMNPWDIYMVFNGTYYNGWNITNFVDIW